MSCPPALRARRKISQSLQSCVRFPNLTWYWHRASTCWALRTGEKDPAPTHVMTSRQYKCLTVNLLSSKILIFFNFTSYSTLTSIFTFGKETKVWIKHGSQLCLFFFQSREKKIEGLVFLRSLAHYHSDTLQARLHDVCLCLIQEVVSVVG